MDGGMDETQTNQTMICPLPDGLVVEAVYYGSGTLCVSSQVGCALACPFCASGRRGLLRNLSATEMKGQLDLARKRGVAVKRVTVSGIGEPLHNPVAVRAFLEEARSMGLPVSLTTTGASLPVFEEFCRLPHNGLMLSLHAGTEATHRLTIPHGPDWDDLWLSLESILPHLSRRRRRKLGINYLLLEGVNDAAQEILSLGDRVIRWSDLTVHLLECNPVEKSPFRSPPRQKTASLADLLRQRGVNVRMANRWRRQSRGGCGTLIWNHQKNSALSQEEL